MTEDYRAYIDLDDKRVKMSTRRACMVGEDLKKGCYYGFSVSSKDPTIYGKNRISRKYITTTDKKPPPMVYGKDEEIGENLDKVTKTKPKDVTIIEELKTGGSTKKQTKKLDVKLKEAKQAQTGKEVKGTKKTVKKETIILEVAKCKTIKTHSPNRGFKTGQTTYSDTDVWSLSEIPFNNKNKNFGHFIGRDKDTFGQRVEFKGIPSHEQITKFIQNKTKYNKVEIKLSNTFYHTGGNQCGETEWIIKGNWNGRGINPFSNHIFKLTQDKQPVKSEKVKTTTKKTTTKKETKKPKKELTRSQKDARNAKARERYRIKMKPKREAKCKEWLK